MLKDEPLSRIARRLDEIRRFPVLTRRMIAGLSMVDEPSCQAGMLGVNKAGLYDPSRKSG